MKFNKWKNPNVTFKDIRNGKIFWSYNRYSCDDSQPILVKFKVLEDYKRSKNSYVRAEVLSNPDKCYTHLSSVLFYAPSETNPSLVMFPHDELITSMFAPIYSTPQAAIRSFKHSKYNS